MKWRRAYILNKFVSMKNAKKFDKIYDFCEEKHNNVLRNIIMYVAKIPFNNDAQQTSFTSSEKNGHNNYGTAA